MVFCGLYPVDGDEYADLREALERLRLNDSSFTYEPETSGALGFGFRCGFLGLLHMEIIRERLEREYDLALVATAPNVEYVAHLRRRRASRSSTTRRRCRLPNEIETHRRAVRQRHDPHADRVRRHADGARAAAARRDAEDGVPLRGPRRARSTCCRSAEIVLDFFDQMKSRTRGYASLDYEPAGYRASNLAKVDVLLNSVPVDAFSAIVHRDKAYDYGRKMTKKLRELIPRQLFDVPIQAAVTGRIIARETVKAKRKDVLAKCYGGDISRKRKLLERQKEGKKRMKQIGRVEVPQEAFVAALRLDE